MNKISRQINLFIGLLIVVCLMLLSAPLWADKKKGGCNGKENCNVEIDFGGGGGDASIGPIENSSAGGSSNVSTKSELSSIYLGAARDTAACFTKVQIGAEVFGIGFSRSDSYCKKVRLIQSKKDEGNFDAAASLECTLPEWREVYGHKRVRNRDGRETPGYRQCKQDLAPNTVSYDAMMAETYQKDEYQEQARLVEERFAQQVNLIQALEQEQNDDAVEIERLKREARSLREAQRADDHRDLVQKSALQAIYEKRVAQEFEEPADE